MTATAESARTTRTVPASTPSSPGARALSASSSSARSCSRIFEFEPEWTQLPFATSTSGSGRPRGVFDLSTKEARLAELDALTLAPGFWDDQRGAQRTLRDADRLRGEIGLWRDLEKRSRDLVELLELAEDAQDEETLAEVASDADELAATFLRERTQLLFSGEYDERSALLTISAGSGGTEANDWAEMLLRMYLRWAERHRFATEIVDQLEGEQTGLKSVTVAVEGRAAYGWLRAERGVHRLVRISPYDSQRRRQTTFALVEVLPDVEDDVEIELNWDEIRVDTFRSQGAGGQHVNKTDSAVRLTHLPTGIVAQSQNERSQTQNKETATKVLKARLLEQALEEKEAELRRIKGDHVVAGWGNQIRSYVLHPYQMVKDLRTGVETSNTGGVLDGDLDTFMQAELEREATGPADAGDEQAR
ncbi:MAG TPA: peptide chain release factor 2 [Candidatus Limnocylindrales bacterium]